MTEKINKNAFNITVDDGSVRQPILNKFGDEIGVFYFRPTDIGIIDRYNQTLEKFDDIVAPLEKLDINPDGTSGSDIDSDIKLFNECAERLYDACNYIFGGNMADAFFGKMHPFSIINGQLYCEKVIDALGNFIAASFESENKKISKRVNKYTHGFRTGKHKNGGKRKGNKK